MKVAIYSKTFDRDTEWVVLRLSDALNEYQCDVKLYRPFGEYINRRRVVYSQEKLFSGYEDLHPETRCLLSIGGD